MYLRHTTVTKSGKTHTYWRLVRSVRVGAKVRQETVAAAKARELFKRSQASDESRVIYDEIIKWDRSWINFIVEKGELGRGEIEGEAEQVTQGQAK